MAQVGTVSDRNLVNGNFNLFRNPKDRTELIGLNEHLTVPLEYQFIDRGNFSSVKIGELKGFPGVTGCSYPIHFQWHNLVYDKVRPQVLSVLREIDKDYKGAFDLEKDSSGRFRPSKIEEVLIRELIVKGTLISLDFNGQEDICLGSFLDRFDYISRINKDNQPNLNYKHQLFAFFGEAEAIGLRLSPGASGWDMDVRTGLSSEGIKYARIQDSNTGDYSFNNQAGSLKCTIGTLRDAESVRLLSVPEAMDFYNAQEIPF
jgi:hypothetical protein